MEIKNFQETNKITAVIESDDWFNISQNGMGCGLKKSYGVIPKVGDELTVHTKGSSFGTIRGMDLNGIPIFYKTDEELEYERAEWLRKNEEEKQERFIKNVAELDKKYNNLPQCFKDRIDRFRKNNDRFRLDYESYELFCCEQAVLIAKECKTGEEIKLFSKKEWDKQIKQVPELSRDHSGNTFSVSVALAYWFLENPENVSKIHGSLSTLVGSEEYGDISK